MSNESTFNGSLLLNFRVQNAINWIQNIDKINPYVLIGKTEAWSADETDPGFIAPPPEDTPDYFNGVWNNMVGAVRIDPESVWLAVARKDWGDPSLGEEGLTFQVGEVVVVNSLMGTNNHPQHGPSFIVYRCVETPESGVCSLSEYDNEADCIQNGGEWTPSASPGGVENIPRGTQSAFDSGDGYKWDYMYTIPPNVQATFISDDWLIVPTDEDLESDPEGWGITDEVVQNGNYRIPQKAFARWVRVFCYIAPGDFSGLIESGNSYRQVTLVANPLEVSNGNGPPMDATAETYNPGDLVEDSGSILYIENMAPVEKTITQTEEIKMTFRF